MKVPTAPPRARRAVHDPIETLLDTHAALQHALDGLAAAIEICRQRMLDRYDMAGGAMGVALRVIDAKGRHHEAVEESTLFPLLREAVPDRAEWLDALLAEHHRIDTILAVARPLLEQLRVELELGHEPAPDLVDAAAHAFGELAWAYRSHMAVEDREIMPIARLALDARARRILVRALEAHPHRR